MWNDALEKSKFHLVHWNQVRRLVEEGGHSIRAPRKMNSALLGSWLWRLGDISDGLWKSILIKKYGLENSGWSPWIVGGPCPFGKVFVLFWRYLKRTSDIGSLLAPR